jgi:arginine utilization regulatory protein
MLVGETIEKERQRHINTIDVVKYLKPIFEKIFEGILIVDKNDESITWVNSVAKSIIFKTLDIDQPVGRSFQGVFRCKLNSLGSTPQHVPNQKDDLLALTVVKYNNDYCFVIVEDKTDMNNIKTRLSVLETILNSVNDGIIISDHESRLTFYNKAMEKMEGLSAKEKIGKYMWEVYEYYDPALSEHRKVLKTNKPIINGYRSHPVTCEKPKYVSYSTYPINKFGVTIGVYSISKNETTLKALLQETIELKSQLFNLNGRSENNGTTNNPANRTVYTFSDIKTVDLKMTQTIKEVLEIAVIDSNVLIVGETGTGKEMFAQSIHNYSKKNNAPFVAINCAAIPENLLESTLFGTVKGAYTGATDMSGLFVEASSGTLFLDEINSLSTDLQAKLLRVVEDKKIRRVGGKQDTPVDCRIISATNEDPYTLIEKGILRRDFFYRLAASVVNIPPLRERQADIKYLSEYFISKFNIKFNKSVKILSPSLLEFLLSYYWPGNVRELEHLIESMMVKVDSDETELTLKSLPAHLKNVLQNNGIDKIKNTYPSANNKLPAILNGIEREMIVKQLKIHNGNISQTAKALGIIRQSLLYRMKKLDINLDNYPDIKNI